MYMDLYDAMGDLEHMVQNIIDNTIATTTYFMLFLLRFSKLLKNVIVTVKEEMMTNEFENNDELELYQSYNQISDTFGRYVIRGTTTLAGLWYLSPMLHLLKSGRGTGNDSKPFELPFRVHAFVDYHDNFRNFVFMYIYQLPLALIALLHVSTISLILNLVLHMCGKFSILSYRIENITENSTIRFGGKVKDLVNMHLKLILMANTVNSSLQIILLIELIQTSIRMAVLVYMLLANGSGNLVGTFTYCLYITTITSMLYLYSYIGERMSYESAKVTEAYYNSNWPKLPMNDQKLLLQCMISGRNTLYVTAGKVYTFSLFGFIGIMKTCFGYVSLLRALV